jgi:uncharacterized protein
MTTRPLPEPTGDTAQFWQSCREGRLTVQKCSACAHLQFYPRRYCTECLGDALTWETVSGRGSVYSYTTTQRALSPAFKDKVPYVVVAVDLAEGPRMLAHLVDCAPEDVRIGMAVAVAFERVADDVALPVFRPAADA